MVTNFGFETVEELQEHFSNSTGVVAPLLTMGGGKFLREFATWVDDYQNLGTSIDVFFPPDPAHAIPFPTPGELLRSTLAVSRPLGNTISLEDLLLKFGLRREVCDQPTHTLSGGEKALVTLAKADVLMPFADNVVISNPARWLYPNRRHLIADVLTIIKSTARLQEFLYLHGENGSVSDDGHYNIDATILRPWWRLDIAAVKIVFPALMEDRLRKPRQLVFKLPQNFVELTSPTLITGDNGVGKSTFAKLLCGVIQEESGSFCMTARGYRNATGRLLFQDIPEQLFAMKPQEHLDRVYEHDAGLRGKAWELFEKLQLRIRELTGGHASQVTLGTESDPSSLLQAKVLLAAERLVSSAGVLICDEPTWGLSRTAGSAFVYALAEEAGKRGIALLLISHDTDLPQELFSTHLHFSGQVGNDDVLIESKQPVAGRPTL